VPAAGAVQLKVKAIEPEERPPFRECTTLTLPFTAVNK
jgi:hypothetical protein